METSPTIGKLSVALAKAQGEIRGATKDSTNPHFRSKYADLASVRDAIQDALSKHGIAYLQFPEGGPDTIKITTILACGEEWMRASFEMKPVKADPQGMGSAITYARRYALMAAVGVAPEDDDGNAASNPKNGQGTPNNVSRGNPLRQEFQGFNYELDGCKSQEQIDAILNSPEFKEFEDKDALQASGIHFAGLIRDKADQMRKKLPERIEDKRNFVKSVDEYPDIVQGFFDRIDVAETTDQLATVSVDILARQAELSADQKKTLNAAYKARAAKIKEGKVAA